jgi:hypothetical protein
MSRTRFQDFLCNEFPYLNGWNDWNGWNRLGDVQRFERSAAIERLERLKQIFKVRPFAGLGGYPE